MEVFDFHTQMFPSTLLTSDFFLSHAHSRIEKCLELATLLYDKLTFIEFSAYTTFLQWEAANTEMTYDEYQQNIENINDALRSIQCCMPPLNKLPNVENTPETTDLNVELRNHCQSVRDLVPTLLRLDIPEITDFLSATYDKLERQLEQVMTIQHRVLILIPILRKQFLRCPQYLEQINRSVRTHSCLELIFIVSAFENRLLRFSVNNYVVHHDQDDYEVVAT